MGKKIVKPPARETSIAEDHPKRIFSSKTICQNVLLAGRLCTNVWRALLQFDISSLPPFLTIINSTLNLHPFYNGFPKRKKTIEAFQILSEWRQEKVCWEKQPLIGLTPVATNFIRQTSPFIGLDLTVLVNEWYTGHSANFGILLKMADEFQNNLIGFASGKYYNSQFWPYLEVDFLKPTSCGGGSEILDIALNLTAADTPRYTAPVNVLLFNYTYQVANIGTSAARVYLEVSPNGAAWQRQTEITTVAPGELVTLVPNNVTKFSRMYYQSLNSGQRTALTVYIQGIS